MVKLLEAVKQALVPPRTRVGRVDAPTRMRVRGVLEGTGKVMAPFSGLAAAAFLVELGARYTRVEGFGQDRREVEVFEPLGSLVLASELNVRTADGVVRISPRALRIVIPSASELGVVPVQGSIPAELHAAAQRLREGTLSVRELSLSVGDAVELSAWIDSGDTLGVWTAEGATLIDRSLAAPVSRTLLVRLVLAALAVALFVAFIAFTALTRH